MTDVGTNSLLAEHVGRIESSKVPWLPWGLVDGAEFRILKADEEHNICVLNFRMGPHTITQNHDHFSVAMAYTVSGEWQYGDKVFKQGDIAYEHPGEVHQPVTKDHSMELLTIFIGTPKDDRFLHNFEEDGSSYIIGMKYMKAFEGLTPEEAAKIDPMDLIVPTS